MKITEEDILFAIKSLEGRIECCDCGYFKKKKSLVMLTDEETGLSRFSCTDCAPGLKPVENKTLKKGEER